MNKKTFLLLAAALALGVLLGWGFFSHEAPETKVSSQEATPESTFTCSMHPQIRQKESGDCPICGMELIPVSQSRKQQEDTLAVAMSPTARELAQVQTATVGTTAPVKNISLTGKVQVDARHLYSQTAHFPGRIERLMVSAEGEWVKKGQVLAYVYAPELVRAQEELLEARKVREQQPALFRSAREKLHHWKLNEAQVQRILEAQKPLESFPIVADEAGYVLEKSIQQGDYLERGEKLYTMANLGKVWLLFDVYQSDISWVGKGDTVHFTLAALPGEEFKGTVSQVDPVIDPQTRVARARVVVANPQGHLRPEMFARGTLRARFDEEVIVVPETAVLWTGERSVVYVKRNGPEESYAMREVRLGPSLNPGFVVKEGLRPGEEVVVHGAFSVDAAAQLAGKPSMMNRTDRSGTKRHQPGRSRPDGAKAPVSKARSPAPNTVLKPLLQAYLDLKEALVQDDTTAALAQATILYQVFGEMKSKPLPAIWQRHQTKLRPVLAKAARAEEIEALRNYFVAISDHLVPIIRAAKPVQAPLYLQFCPMAQQGQGAYWLSRKVEVKNPYYGASMLTCGEVKETLP